MQFLCKCLFWWAMLASNDQRLASFSRMLPVSALVTNRAALLRDPMFTDYVSSFSTCPEGLGYDPAGHSPCISVIERMCGAWFDSLRQTLSGVKAINLHVVLPLSGLLFNIAASWIVSGHHYGELPSNPFQKSSLLVSTPTYLVTFSITIWNLPQSSGAKDRVADFYCGIVFLSLLILWPIYW